MSFVSDIFGGLSAAKAAKSASNAIQGGAKAAQTLEEKKAQDALNFQNGVWSNTQAAEQPYQELGGTSANALRDLLAKGFAAPTLEDAENSPGFQFRLQQGTNALTKNAAALGNVMSGNTGKALEDYGQNLAESQYDDDFNRAMQTYMTNYQSLLGGTNAGLTSTGQLGQFGQEAANNTSNVDLTTAQQQALQINNAAAARASGYLGAAKGYGTAFGGAMDAAQLAFLGA
jgi:hypothetical protein